MEVVLFTAVAVILYFVSDRLLLVLEARAGRRFEYRSLVFFAILLTLAVVVFGAIRQFATGG
jgi:hypothetical protein